MTVNEIFYSLQGEGRWSGTPAVFLRLSGCNLNCDFCDTQHRQGTEMTEDEIMAAVLAYPARHIVITGGEPTLQLTASLVGRLHAAGYFVQIETNGTITLDRNLEKLVDWVTCSPKYGVVPRIRPVHELKVVYDPEHLDWVEKLADVEPLYDYAKYLQPCDRGDDELNRLNLRSCIAYIKDNPQWKLSLQTHKMLGLR